MSKKGLATAPAAKPHWSQLPENKAKVRRRTMKALRTRRRKAAEAMAAPPEPARTDPWMERMRQRRANKAVYGVPALDTELKAELEAKRRDTHVIVNNSGGRSRKANGMLVVPLRLTVRQAERLIAAFIEGSLKEAK